MLLLLRQLYENKCERLFDAQRMLSAYCKLVRSLRRILCDSAVAFAFSESYIRTPVCLFVGVLSFLIVSVCFPPVCFLASRITNVIAVVVAAIAFVGLSLSSHATCAGGGWLQQQQQQQSTNSDNDGNKKRNKNKYKNPEVNSRLCLCSQFGTEADLFCCMESRFFHCLLPQKLFFRFWLMSALNAGGVECCVAKSLLLSCICVTSPYLTSLPLNIFTSHLGFIALFSNCCTDAYKPLLDFFRVENTKSSS